MVWCFSKGCGIHHSVGLKGSGQHSKHVFEITGTDNFRHRRGKIWIPVGISILDTLNRWSTLLSRRILYSHRKLFGLIVFFLSRIIHLFASRWGKIIGNYIFYFRKIFRKITKCGVSISIRSSCTLLNFVGTLFLFSGYFLKVLQQTDLHWKIFKFLRAVWIYIGKWKLRYCWHNAVITVIAYFTS
jgi:hypothetical protein